MGKKYKVIDGCPVPRKLYDELYVIKKATGITYNSIYRGHDAIKLLRANGKSSQKELYDGYIAGKPGYNPANPPGRSTHELRNDGVAYAGPAGMKLRWWCVGIDCSDVNALVRAASKRGWVVTLTYPGNPREGHHANFRKAPRFSILKPLKVGSRGRRVGRLTGRLHYLGYLDFPGRKKKTGKFDKRVNLAVRKFQKDYHQKVDGIVGPQTQKQLLVAVRKKKRRRRKAKR